MNPLHLLRMARWARRPPSAKRVMLVFGVVAVALVIAGLDWMGWWPEWARTEPIRRRF